MPGNALNWFEIPVTDIDRATVFYQAILGVELERVSKEDMEMAMFPVPDMQQNVSGTLIQSALAGKPSCDGTRVYLNCQGQLDAVVERVTAAGGSIVMPILAIPPNGRIALIGDSEGNVVGLHSMD